jgi:lipase
MPDLDVRGRNINVREYGNGPAVILLHSASSHSGQWKGLWEHLGDTCRILAPDLHGYGGSDSLPNDGRPYFRHDGAIVTSLLGLVEGPVHLVGHSLGGAIAIRSALEHAERVASLTLIEPVLFNLLEDIEDSTAAEHRRLAETMTALARAGDREGAARAFLDSRGGGAGWRR